MIAATDRLEYVTAGETLRDFCLWEYEAAAPPDGKFRSVNLLYHSFEVAGASPACFELVDGLRDALGRSQTVFGVKWTGSELRWELYFYDYRRRERTRSVARVVDALKPFIACDVPVDERLPYFMFSLDVDRAFGAPGGRLDEVHLYVGTPGSSVSAGLCYSVTARGAALENLYYFFDADKQMAEIRDKASASAHVDTTRVALDQILWPELRRCKVIVVANKKQNDAVYFVGLDVDQLVFFLKRMRYPAAIVAFVETHRARLDHLRFDVGLDYRMEQGRLVFLKSGYYGVF